MLPQKICHLIGILWMTLCLVNCDSYEKQNTGIHRGKITSAKLDEIVKAYKSIAEVPNLSGARILETSATGITIESTWTQRNLEQRSTQRFTREHTLNASFNTVYKSFPVDVTTELMASTTDDNRRKAVLKQATTEGMVKQYIEIWDRNRRVKNYDLSALGVHGDVYTDPEFGSFSWSPDCTRLLYIAEKILPQSAPFYKQTSQSTSKLGSDSEQVERGNKFLFKPDWGERLVGKHCPVIVLLDTQADTVKVLPGVPDEVSPGQVLWTPDGHGVVGVAWKHEPKYMGLSASNNVLSWIFHLKNGEYSNISRDGCAVWAPRFNPSGTYLVWLERFADRAQHNIYRLVRQEWNRSMKMDPEIVVDIVDTSIAISDEKIFYGLYELILPSRCWSSNSTYLFLSTVQRFNKKSYVINIETKFMTEIENDNSSLSILDVKDDIIAFSKSSFVEPNQLILGRFDPLVSNLGIIDRVAITPPIFIDELKNMRYEFIEHVYDNDDAIKDFNFIYFGPQTGKNASIPLLAFPHGGPQGSSYNSFRLETSFYALLGFGVLLVNYRGSTGMGSKNLEYLLGKVGEADVIDVVTATQETLQRFPWLDASRMGVCGGSHGGLLAAHLSGQYPTLYKAVVAKNPVIDIPTVFTTSDVGDMFSYLMGFGNVAATPQPSYRTMFLKMLDSSPIMHASEVRAPTLICVGANDLRAPASQGKLWYQRLKANGVVTKLLVYEDNHALSSGPVEIDYIINSALWLLEYTSPGFA